MPCQIIYFPILLLSFLVYPNCLCSTVIYVNHNSTGEENGSNWEHAFGNLQDALEIAESGDSIWVAAGTYLPTNDTDRTKSFHLKSGLTLLGGFVGTEQTLEERNFTSNLTILSGDIGVINDVADNSFTILYAKQCNELTILDGFIIREGLANGLEDCTIDPRKCFGAGMYIESTESTDICNIIIRNCNFEESIAKEAAALKVECVAGEVNLRISQCRFRSNILFDDSSGNGGGAIKINSTNGHSKIYIDSSSFITNEANSSSGGAIYYNDDDDNPITDRFSVESCLFSGNVSGDGGGAIIAFSSQSDSIVTINNSIFQGNLEYGSGGGALSVNGHYKIQNSLFTNNSANKGGAIYEWGAISKYVNCIFNNNSAEQGGALHHIGVSTIIHCTFYNNFAVEGTGVFGEIATDTFYNCIFWDNAPSTSLFATNNPDFNHFSLQNCLINNDNCFEESGLPISCNTEMLYNINPEFEDPTNDDFRLYYCSPAIDKGLENILDLIDEDKDFNGEERIKNNLPDLGAYEVDGFSLKSIISDISCFNFDDGTINIMPQNGFPPYTFEWSTGYQDSSLNMLSEGIYSISVEDSNNCMLIDSFQINNPDPITFEIEMIPATGIDSVNGSLEIVDIQGGKPPYQYYWSSSDTLALYSDLLPGEYSLSIIDNNGCDTTAIFIVDFTSSFYLQDFMYKAIISPNPASLPNIQFSTSRVLNLSLQIIDISGRTILNSQITIPYGESQYNIPITLEPGTYFFRLMDRFGYNKNLRAVILQN